MRLALEYCRPLEHRRALEYRQALDSSKVNGIG